MWFDVDDAMNSDVQDPNFRRFIQDGYCVLESAVSVEAIDVLVAEMNVAFRDKNSYEIFYQDNPSGETRPLSTFDGDASSVRFVDLMMSLDSAQRVLMSEKIIDFLTKLFEAPPVLFQSLSFEYGSQQGLHQDTAYVVTVPPMNLVGVWIALEDVVEGSGELMYGVGSHNLPYFFQNRTGKFHWDSQLDGHAIHEEYAEYLRQECVTNGKRIQTFLPKKGDVLIWHSQLAHGGSQITNPEKTRRSLVGHFCPYGTLPNWAISTGLDPKISTVNPNAYVMSQYEFSGRNEKSQLRDFSGRFAFRISRTFINRIRKTFNS